MYEMVIFNDLIICKYHPSIFLPYVKFELVQCDLFAKKDVSLSPLYRVHMQFVKAKNNLSLLFFEMYKHIFLNNE